MSIELLKAVVLLRRAKDDKDYPLTEVNCIPMSSADRLEIELKNRKASGILITVQMGRIYVDKAPNTDYYDQVDEFLARIDADTPT